jgi:type IV pilus assembly protein PilQ
MQALESTGDIKILSQPELTVQDNREATITSGRDMHAWTTDEEGKQKIEKIPAKLISTITPHVSPENKLMMRVTLQNRAPDTHTVLDIPDVTERSIDTTLLVKNGETIVLGGLKLERDNNSDNGVPILKDLPLLGYIFNYKEESKNTHELLMIVRATIIPVGGKQNDIHAPVTELNHTSIK